MKISGILYEILILNELCFTTAHLNKNPVGTGLPRPGRKDVPSTSKWNQRDVDFWTSFQTHSDYFLDVDMV